MRVSLLWALMVMIFSLRCVDFSKRSSLTVVIGAGKSTLLKLIVGKTDNVPSVSSPSYHTLYHVQYIRE